MMDELLGYSQRPLGIKYVDDDIQVLSPMLAVRKNPWMYIGSVGSEGVHQLLQELIHNSLDEVVLGHANKIRVRLGHDFVEVQDNGRGIPTAIHPTEGVSSCEVALTRLHSGSKFTKKQSQFMSGLHGVGLSCVNALSSDLKITVERGGQRFQQEYSRGQAIHPLQQVGRTSATGTTIRFWPDSEIFKDFIRFDDNFCRDLLETLSLLCPEVEIVFDNQLLGRVEVFSFPEGGIHRLYDMRFPLGERALLSPPLEVMISTKEFKLRACFTWTTAVDEKFYSFVNYVTTTHGGTHVNAFRAGIVRAVNSLAHDLSGEGENFRQLEVNEICEGLFAIMDCKISHPNFEGQIKARLTNIDIIKEIEEETARQLLDFFGRHPNMGALLLTRIQEARRVRLAAKRITEKKYLQQSRQSIDEEVYKAQFGARSINWHDSAVWITDAELLARHAECCEVGPDSLALDVCCGSGVVGASFRPRVKKMVGLDLTPEMVQLARNRLDEVHQGNVYHLPFEDNYFDLVCTREVLHLLPCPEKPVSEIWRVLKPGGQFIVGQILPFSEIDAPWMYRVFKKKQPLLYNMFQEEDFRQLLVGAGFTDLKMTELNVIESIDRWIDTVETTQIHRHEIRDLFFHAPTEVRAVHPFEILPSGEILDTWRWCIFSVRKPPPVDAN